MWHTHSLMFLPYALQLFDTYKKEMETGVQQRNQLLEDRDLWRAKVGLLY
jgi:hypothetical protein